MQTDLKESLILTKSTIKYRPEYFKELHNNDLLPDWIREHIVVYLAFYLVYLLRKQK